MKTKLAKITLATSLSALMLSATFLSCMSLIPQTAKAETTQHASTQITTNQAKEITPRPTDEIIYTTAQGLAVKKQNNFLYMTINGTTCEIVGQGNGLVSGYTMLEYLTSDKNEGYINTEFYPSSTSKFEIAFASHTLKTGESYNMTGGIWGNDKNDSFMLGHQKSSGLQFWYGNQVLSISYTELPFVSGQKLIATLTGDGKVTVTSPTNTINKSFTAQTFTSGLPFTLFAHNKYDRIDKDGTKTIYHAKFYKNNILEKHFIPAKNSSGILGMYEVVGKTFYPSTSSGTFIAGPILTGLKYQATDPATQAIAQDHTKRTLAGFEFILGIEKGYLLCKKPTGEFLQVLI